MLLISIYPIPVGTPMRGTNGACAGHPEVRTIDPFQPEAIELLWRMRREIDGLYGEVTTSPPPQHEFQVPRAAFMAAFVQGTMIGCGGIKPWDSRTAILKRLFVVPEQRRKGVARMLMHELEQQARTFGYERMVLDTGFRQEGALALYLSLGYRRASLTGRNDVKDWGVCFEKVL